MISTRDLSGLPDVDTLKRLMQSMAMLDAVLSPEWEFRYYSFNAKWSKGEQMGSMRNGEGDDLFALFNEQGCFLKGFWHESKMTPYARDPKRVWPGVLDSVPAEFNRALNQAAFSMEDTTFCIWRKYGDDRWHCGEVTFPKVELRYPGQRDDPDGSEFLLSPYDANPETYWSHARSESLTLEHVEHVYDQKPLTTTLVSVINPEVTLRSLAVDITEIGYPRRSAKR